MNEANPSKKGKNVSFTKMMNYKLPFNHKSSNHFCKRIINNGMKKSILEIEMTKTYHCSKIPKPEKYCIKIVEQAK